MSQEISNDKSIIRLRIGVVLILLWMLPFWLLGPRIASNVNTSDVESLTVVITAIIMIVQTVLGLAGVYLAGKETARIIKKTPKKRLLKTIWQILRHGNSAG